ncbi:MAG: DNA repair protein RadA [Termitinemataceae bacterium]|nr:MAG: DNA repair protein RadA [Termitinemataceae bacterium]
MKKQKGTVFKCSACGHEEPKWLGRCPECGQWNTLTQAAAASASLSTAMGRRKAGGIADVPRPISMPLAAVESTEGVRILSGCTELDRVLGGGIMKRSCTLVGGEPGIGKSTLLLQIASTVQTKGRVLYVSGEESAGQVKMRADRLGLNVKNIEIFCSGQLEEIETVLESVKPVIIIVDSAQTLYTPDAGIVPGTINQLKYCSFELISWVKEHDAALFLVAHITKDGVIAGPKTLEHMVDTVLYFEQTDGERRFLRASKNRFGSVDEIGIWTMSEKGLSAVEDPSLLFLVRREGDIPAGIATAAVLEGSRTLLVEIQALCVPAKGSLSRVYSDRIDQARVARIAATLEKCLGLRMADNDIYVNVAGGIRIVEVGVELAVAASIYSARTGIPLPARTALAGELSLAAEVMPVRRLAGRIKTSLGLGFDRFISPLLDSRNAEETLSLTSEQGKHIIVHDLKSAIAALFGK